MHLDVKIVAIDSRPICLTRKEYGIFELLSLRKGTVLTKEMLFNHLYGGVDEPELEIIDVFVCKLREKLSSALDGDNYIDTVWGRGYVLRDPSAPVETLEGMSESPKGSPDPEMSTVRTGRLSVHLDAKTVEIDSRPIYLTRKEYGILELLSLRKGTVLTREMLLNHLYRGVDEPELKIIDVFVRKLRKKLSSVLDGDNYIGTVWGRGYVLRDPDVSPEKD